MPSEKRVYLADNWQVLGDFHLEHKTVAAIAAARHKTDGHVRGVISGAWAIGITTSDVAAYLRSA